MIYIIYLANRVHAKRYKSLRDKLTDNNHIFILAYVLVSL